MKKTFALVLSVILIFSSLSVVGFAEDETAEIETAEIETAEFETAEFETMEIETTEFETAKIETYDLRVGSVTVDSLNKNDILGDGTASFDADSNTLILKNACITEYDLSDSVAAYIYYSGNKDLNIKLRGENKIIGNDPEMDSSTPDGIYSADLEADILFKGNGSLLIEGAIDDGVYSNGGIKANGQKFVINTEAMGLHAMYGPLVIKGNTFLDIDSMYGIYNRYESVDIRGGKIKILCPKYGIYSGKEPNDGYSHIITISGGDIFIEETTGAFNPIFVGKDITISGGRIFSRSYCGLWSNGTIHVTGGYIDLKAKVDGLLQTGEKDHIFITGGTLILETEEGNAFSYMEGNTYPAQRPILNGYENVSIDYGSDFDNLKKGQNLESAEEDKYWESQVVIIRAKNDPQPKPKDTVVIEIGPKAEELPEETESNPDTGAPVPGIGRAAVLAAEFLVSKRNNFI